MYFAKGNFDKIGWKLKDREISNILNATSVHRPNFPFIARMVRCYNLRRSFWNLVIN